MNTVVPEMEPYPAIFWDVLGVFMPVSQLLGDEAPQSTLIRSNLNEITS